MERYEEGASGVTEEGVQVMSHELLRGPFSAFNHRTSLGHLTSLFGPLFLLTRFPIS